MKELHRAIYLVGGSAFTPGGIVDDGCVVVRGRLIAAVGAMREVAVPADAEVIDVSGRRVIPGLIDLHVHGMQGQDVAGGDIDSISKALARFGVTAFLATLAPVPYDELVETIERLAEWVEPVAAGAQEHGSGKGERAPLSGARMVGFNLEGPYLSPRRAGALNPRFFRPPSQSEASKLLHAGRGGIRVVTIAPELEGAPELASWLSSQGIICSVGHSEASFEQVSAAVQRGLSYATHTFNAMREFHHREPGVVGAVLIHDEVTTEVIADGYHVHPAAIRLLLRTKGVGRTCLVSDASPLAGLPPGAYAWLGRKVIVDGATARLEDGTLAGSVAPLNVALRYLVEVAGVPLATALKAASSTPARVLSLTTGVIEVGRDADLVVLDDAYQPCLTMVQGKIVYRKA